jgi:hypothetical protein
VCSGIGPLGLKRGYGRQRPVGPVRIFVSAEHGMSSASEFHNPRLRKVIADTFPHLTASIRVLAKNGFTQTGPGADEGSTRFELAVQ